METGEGYQVIEDPNIIDQVVGEYLKLREQGLDRAQAKVVIPDLVSGVSPYEVGRILTKYAAGESLENISDCRNHKAAA